MMRCGRSAYLIVVLLVCAIPVVSSAEEPRYWVECSADSYALGDSAFFTWTNNSDSSLVVPYQPPYEIHDELTGEVVYAGELPTEFWLPPHESVDLSWAQKDLFEEQVPPGAYLVYIRFSFNGDPPPPWDHVEDGFQIEPPVRVVDGPPGSSTSSWGRLKQSYRCGLP